MARLLGGAAGEHRKSTMTGTDCHRLEARRRRRMPEEDHLRSSRTTAAQVASAIPLTRARDIVLVTQRHSLLPARQAVGALP